MGQMIANPFQRLDGFSQVSRAFLNAFLQKVGMGLQMGVGCGEFLLPLLGYFFSSMKRPN
jgi:hypothetical protein